MKKWIAAAWLLFLMIIIFGFFWYNQLKYTLPTPIPSGYQTVKSGKVILLKNELNFNNKRPVFLHFFNPDCPCSRFNIEHFKSLVKSYHNKVNFAIVLMTDKQYTEVQIQERYNINIPVVSDTTIATQSGVYSTPQAVILDADRKLYYRGNYNKTRYCTDEKSSYAKLALNGLLNHTSLIQFDQSALTAYGCTLPNCNK